MNTSTADPLTDTTLVEDRDRTAVATGDSVHVCPKCRRTAAVVDRFELDSTAGPARHIRIRCDQGRHHFTLMVGSPWV